MSVLKQLMVTTDFHIKGTNTMVNGYCQLEVEVNADQTFWNRAIHLKVHGKQLKRLLSPKHAVPNLTSSISNCHFKRLF